MSDLARRAPLTPETARHTPLRSMIDRIDRFRSRHPEIKISAPYFNGLGKWEVSEPDQPARAWDKGQDMIADLERRYPNNPQAREG
jgi:hypothetical protein